MKLSLSRARDTPPGAAPAADQPPTPRAPRGTVPAEYAAVIDGERLWLAVGDRPGTLGLSSSTGEVVTGEPMTDQPGYLATIIPLASLADSTYEPVAIAPGGRTVRRLWLPHLKDVTQMPDSARTRHHHLERDDGGLLRLTCKPVDPTGWAARIGSVDGDGVRLTIYGTTDTVAFLSRETEEEEAVLELATEPDQYNGCPASSVEIRAHDLPAELSLRTRLHVRTDQGWKPVSIGMNPLGDALADMPLPAVTQPETQRPRMRLRWVAPQSLIGRIFSEGEA